MDKTTNEINLLSRLKSIDVSCYLSGNQIIIPVNQIKNTKEKNKISRSLVKYYNIIDEIESGKFTNFLSKSKDYNLFMQEKNNDN